MYICLDKSIRVQSCIANSKRLINAFLPFYEEMIKIDSTDDVKYKGLIIRLTGREKSGKLNIQLL